ncbi:MAG: hypothetical protein F4X11_06310 [Acidobacteria bacterium]|nr:hypothetical protein [Acidobacteriota bacterium]
MGGGELVVAFRDRVENRLDQSVVGRAVGVAERLDAQLADADGQFAAGLVAHVVPAGERIDDHYPAVPLGQQVKISFAARTSPSRGPLYSMAPPLPRAAGPGCGRGVVQVARGGRPN